VIRSWSASIRSVGAIPPTPTLPQGEGASKKTLPPFRGREGWGGTCCRCQSLGARGCTSYSKLLTSSAAARTDMNRAPWCRRRSEVTANRDALVSRHAPARRAASPGVAAPAASAASTIIVPSYWRQRIGVGSAATPCGSRRKACGRRLGSIGARASRAQMPRELAGLKQGRSTASPSRARRRSAGPPEPPSLC